MRHRKTMTPRKPKDVLGIALKNLVIGDGGLFCTARTYTNIWQRMDDFSRSHQDRTINTVPYGAIRKIRRVA